MREYIPKDEVLAIIKSMPRDLVEEYVYELDGIWLDDDEEKLQLSPETSTDTPTNTSTNGTYIRDGRLMHDLVYRGEAEVTDTVEESITIQTGQTYGKSAYVAGNPDPDLISRQVAIEAWDKLSKRGRTEFDQVLMTLPSAETRDKRTETHGVCSDCISRQAAIDAVEKAVFKGVAKSAIESLPPAEPERPKRTETMMVDGEPTEIDPLSYEVGYSHGQERPEGEWIFNPKDAIDLMFAKPKCNKCGFESADGGNFCPNCGADMRGDKE